MHENLKERRLGVTAPTMSAEAAERWRQSYRKYRHKKHLEKRKFNLVNIKNLNLNLFCFSILNHYTSFKFFNCNCFRYFKEYDA